MKPALVIDLQKASAARTWREELHPRDEQGRFTRIRGGSRIVTRTGKTGRVHKVTDTHYHVTADDGSKFTVSKKNAVHYDDYEAAMKAAKKNKRKASAAAKKAKATKASNKANATGKTGAAKPLADPTKKAAKKKPAAKKTSEAAENKTLVVPVTPKKRKAEKPLDNEQNRAIAEVAEIEKTPEKANLDKQWQSAEVQNILKKPVNKRSAEEIRRVAGKLTKENDKLARHVVHKMAAARGMSILGQVYRLKRHVGGNRSKEGKEEAKLHGATVAQETGLYGDLLQSARASMFATLSSVLSGSQNPRKGTAIGAHVISRMRQQLHRDMYDILNTIPAPHEIRTAIGDAWKAEETLTGKLGRTPTHDEVASYLQKNSKAFREAPIMQPPVWNEDKGEWEAKNQRVTDPSERLRVLKNYADQQKATHLDQGVMDERTGERRNVAEAMADRTAASPEARAIERERQQELRTALPKAMKEMGLTDDEIRVMVIKFSNPSSTTSKPTMTSPEVAAYLKEHYGMDVTSKWVDNRITLGMQKIKRAREQNHPALEQLRMLKSLVVRAILKMSWEIDLYKALTSWGLTPDVLEMRPTRIVYGRSREDILKSLEPHEYVGSFVTFEDGEVAAQVTELTLPEGHELRKAFMDTLQKAMFPHKGASNAEINKKAQEYVRANKQRYASLADQQLGRIRGKGGSLTWSEELLLKNPGSAWITWGGKRILINTGNGEIIYDSRNEAHREDYNQGAQEDKIEFHHEKEAGVSEENAHEHDHGIQAFRNEFMNRMRDEWIKKEGNKIVGGIKGEFLQHNSHKALDVYRDLSDEERKALDDMGADREAKAAFLGDHFLRKEGVIEALQQYRNGELSEEDIRQRLAGLGSLAGRNSKMMASFLGDVKKHDPATEEGLKKLAESFGAKEMTRAGEEASKNLLPEGKYMIGNPITGKTMIVHVGGAFTGGRGSRKKDESGKEEKGKYTSEVLEAFDPDGRIHETINTWGDLGRALGYTGKEASDLKATLVAHANTAPDKPFMQKISDEEFAQHRAKTKAGLQESMLHKDFRLVDQTRDKDGNITSQTFAQKMPDGTMNHITVDGSGRITDPLMRRLLNQRAPVTNEKELNELLKNAVGNRVWVTAHFGSDIHIGDALGHHVQLEYDGKGAPRVVGGKYDGYRYVDRRDIPKGAIDPATGEPVKALFRNGRLVDRRFTTKNDVPMREGNPVMYRDGDSYKKGRIYSIEGDNYKITDGQGHVIGIFKKEDLKPAKQEGRMLSEAGTAVLKVAQTGTHRLNVQEALADMSKGRRKLLEEALQRAHIQRAAFDSDGNLRNELELSDAAHKRLSKILGRSKAGREILSKFNSAYTKELELHVPERLRSVVEAEGVRVLADGTARISASKFEQLRDVLNNAGSGISLTYQAQEHLADHFARKDRVPKEVSELRKKYQPSTIESGDKEFDKHYKAQFNEKSYLMDPSKGLYGTQLDGVSHLIERGRGIAGHGMGTGKTILGVVAGLHTKAQALARGEKPKKTLIVAPKGIMSDWGKEIATHTNSKALYIGGASSFAGAKRGEDGKRYWGQAGTEQEAVDIRKFKKGSHAGQDHDFHIVSYDTFMRNRDFFANSGEYDNIVIDEVHAFKNQKGKRGAALAETTDKFKNVWGLSGTPMENDPREMHALVDTITGGRHELGSLREFQNKYMMKDRNGKLVGIKPSMAEKLGDILASIVQFRSGEDVTYNDGSKIRFPHLVGQQSNDPGQNPSPPVDFIGDMVDRSRDHQTTDYYGTKHSITDFETSTKQVTNAKSGETYEVTTTTPKNVSPELAAMYDTYKSLEAKYLPASKLNELASAAATGIDQGQKGQSNYLTAMQKLQKFLNAPLAHKMYVEGGNAIDSDATDAQAEKPAKGGASGLVEGKHYIVDENGFKRYFESDGKGGYLRNPDGSPKLLPPLHKQNPKAQYLQDRIHKYLDSLMLENRRRVARGDKPLVPKVVVKSNYTTFGTDIVDNVLKEVRNTHPIFAELARQGYTNLTHGQFTGEAKDREETKSGFRGNKHDYLNNQGNLWATTVSPAGKEGVDFGNAHLMIHYDQDWNPQKMAQFTARVRRSDSAKTHEQVGRANAVRVESLHVPNTVEDFIFNAQDAKMRAIQHVVQSTRDAEAFPKLGETEGTVGYGARGFTSRKQPRQPVAPARPDKAPSIPKTGSGGAEVRKPMSASADKALKLVVLL
jgi:preprotein translocase subunit YajC